MNISALEKMNKNKELKDWITEVNADKEADDSWFRRYFLGESPRPEPKYRPCRFCGADQRQWPGRTVWDCMNPECKSHEMRRRVDADFRRRHPTWSAEG